MDPLKQQRLEAAGWKVGSAAEFLELSPEEAAYIDLKLALSSGLRERRLRQGLTQHALAKKMGSSQSRVAKMEAADPTVSLDLLVKALLAAGATREELAALIGTPESRAA